MFLRKLVLACCASALALGIVCLDRAHAVDPGGIGIRAGGGTDIYGGVAFGGGINYLFDLGGRRAMEVGLVVFGNEFEEDSNNGFNTYEEETEVVVVGLLGNFLFNYERGYSGPFAVLGAGIGVISVDWREESPTDTSLGTPLPGGGSFQEEEATTAGLVLNLGAGWNFPGGFDARAEIPIIIIAGAPGEANALVPTFTATVGYRF